VKTIYHSVAPSGHPGSVNIPKALSYLALEEHKGYPKLDEVDANNYLQCNNIDKDDTDQELSY
jgi:hypothetical protein|tara:strand:- start:68 stop:256 length:189 start_codon:yes stop_codon:yes gene_type:complete